MSPFGWWIAVYFALATLAAGAGAAACALVAQSASQGRSPSIRAPLLLAGVAIALGAGALILDLEQPGRFWLTLTSYNPDSWLSRGSRIIALFGLIALALFLVTDPEPTDRRPSWPEYGLAALLAPLAVLVAIYPAFVLDQEAGRPLWHSALLPVLFAAGALHVATAIARAPALLEVAATALEFALFAAYLLAVGVTPFVTGAVPCALLVVAALGAWLLPLAMLRRDHAHRPARSSKSSGSSGSWRSGRGIPWLRVACIAIGCLAIRAAILLAGQRTYGPLIDS